MRRLLLAPALVSISGCILLTSFGEETQKCDTAAPASQQCLPGFRCVNEVCVHADGGLVADGGIPDAGGFDAGVDAGSFDAGSDAGADAGNTHDAGADAGRADAGDGGR